MGNSTLFDHLTQPKGLWKSDFSYHLPCKIIFGIGVSNRIGEEARKLRAKRVLVITDKGMLKAGIVGVIRDSLGKPNIDVEVHDGVVANPTIKSVEEAFSVMKEIKPNVLIGLGGGSSIDTAKVVAVMDTNPIPVPNMLKGTELKNPRRIPLIAIETAAGTGAEVTLFAPVMDTERKIKISIASAFLMPDVAICDPLLTISLPSKATAEMGIDALSHALESYVAKDSWPVTDALALSAIKIIFANLRTAVVDGRNIRAREGMLMGSLMAAMAFPFAGAGMIHGTAGPLSGFYNFAHGLTVGIMMPYIEEFNLSSNYRKFATIAQAAGEKVDGTPTRENAEKAIKVLIDVTKDVGIPGSLKKVGVKHEDIPALTQRAFEHGCMSMNPRRMSIEDIRNVYEQAFEGTLTIKRENKQKPMEISV